jgi:hypothetical protein
MIITFIETFDAEMGVSGKGIFQTGYEMGGPDITDIVFLIDDYSVIVLESKRSISRQLIINARINAEAKTLGKSIGGGKPGRPLAGRIFHGRRIGITIHPDSEG